jgi:hypothetical protein
MLTITWGETQSVIQLAVALNLVYFTLRTGNRPAYEEVEFVVAELERAVENPAISSSTLRMDISGFFSNVHRFRNHLRQQYNRLDTFMMPFAYSACILLSLVLFVSTLYYSDSVSYLLFSFLFILGYGAIFTCFIFEVLNAARARSLYLTGYRLITRVSTEIAQHNLARQNGMIPEVTNVHC